MRIVECEQGSPEWHALRAGRVTASRVADVVARTKSGYSASRKNYAAELICERLTGRVDEGYTNAIMQRGIDLEPEAVMAYELLKGVSTERVGFVIHPSIEMAGASPDRVVEQGIGLVEVKCPLTATHIETLLKCQIPSRYITQMQWQMACTGAKWCDYVSYDDRVPGEMALYVERVRRDDDLILTLQDEVETFLSEIDETITALKERYPTFEPSEEVA